MATVIISELPPAPNGTGSGSSQGTDLFPATDTTDTTSASTGTTKKYTLSEIFNFMLHSQGLTTYSAVRVATTAALTATYANGASGVGATLTNAGAQAALSIDGVALSLNDRVLVKNQASTLQNGIYFVSTVGTGSTNWVLTRATDYDASSEIVQYGVVLVNQGTVSAGLLYQETGAGPFTVGVTAITFALYVAGSGGSVNTGTANQVAYYAASGSTVSGVGPGSAGQIFQSNGSGSPPAYTTATYPTTAGTSGTLLRSDGTNWINSTATFADTYAVSTLLYASGSNTVSGLATANSASLVTNASGVPAMTASMTDGQVIIGSTGGTPAPATLTAGTGITISNAAGSITISSPDSGLSWFGISGTTQSAAVNSGYVVQNAAQTTITLPATCAIGDTVSIRGLGAAGWILAANTGQTIKYITATTSSGGTLTSAEQYDTVDVTCIVANTTWSVNAAATTGLTVA